MNEIQILDNEEFGDIRTIFINGEPWFLGEDVVRELGHSKINTNVSNEDIITVQQTRILETETYKPYRRWNFACRSTKTLETSFSFAILQIMQCSNLCTCSIQELILDIGGKKRKGLC